MNRFSYEHSLSNLIRNNFIFIFWGICITLGLFYLGNKVDNAMKYQRTTIIPDHIARKVTLTGEDLPADFLEDYAETITGYMSNFTPATARSRFGKLLQYFHPDSFPTAKQTFYEMADTVERTKLSSSFVIDKPIEVDTEKKIITVTGLARLSVESKFIDTDEKTYFITYTITKGLFQLKSIEEKVKEGTAPGGGKDAK